jgi:hypothetical protein
MGVQENVLQQVVGFIRGSGHPEHEVVEPAGVCAIQLLECVCVTMPATLRQLEIDRSHVSVRVRRARCGGGLPRS